jgi:hypothetical protein
MRRPSNAPSQRINGFVGTPSGNNVSNVKQAAVNLPPPVSRASVTSTPVNVSATPGRKGAQSISVPPAAAARVQPPSVFANARYGPRPVSAPAPNNVVQPPIAITAPAPNKAAAAATTPASARTQSVASIPVPFVGVPPGAGRGSVPNRSVAVVPPTPQKSAGPAAAIDAKLIAQVNAVGTTPCPTCGVKAAAARARQLAAAKAAAAAAPKNQVQTVADVKQPIAVPKQGAAVNPGTPAVAAIPAAAPAGRTRIAPSHPTVPAAVANRATVNRRPTPRIAPAAVTAPQPTPTAAATTQPAVAPTRASRPLRTSAVIRRTTKDVVATAPPSNGVANAATPPVVTSAVAPQVPSTAAPTPVTPLTSAVGATVSAAVATAAHPSSTAGTTTSHAEPEKKSSVARFFGNLFHRDSKKTAVTTTAAKAITDVTAATGTSADAATAAADPTATTTVASTTSNTTAAPQTNKVDDAVQIPWSDEFCTQCAAAAIGPLKKTKSFTSGELTQDQFLQILYRMEPQVSVFSAYDYVELFAVTVQEAQRDYSALVVDLRHWIMCEIMRAVVEGTYASLSRPVPAPVKSLLDIYLLGFLQCGTVQQKGLQSADKWTLWRQSNRDRVQRRQSKLEWKRQRQQAATTSTGGTNATTTDPNAAAPATVSPTRIRRPRVAATGSTAAAVAAAPAAIAPATAAVASPATAATDASV